jgi:hypothetical protein
MSDKKKSKSHDDKPKKKGLIPKKLKKNFLKFGILGVLGLAAFVIYKPDLIQDPNQRMQAEAIRVKIQLTAQSIGNQLGNMSNKNLNLAVSNPIPEGGVVLGTSQVNVDTIVTGLLSKIQLLPTERIEDIKLKICADVLKIDLCAKAATESGTSGTN